MKDICKTILLTVFLLNTCIIITLGQTEVTRYTPNGSPVRAYNEIPEMSSGDKADWSDYVANHYPQATELNTHSATRSYNCHAYAWHISEGGDDVWIGYYPEQTADEDVYWTDGSYLNQSVETGAEKISYYNGNHSAIQTSTAGIYKSKWGEGPLMQHAGNYGPSIYNMNQRRYYVRPYISGSHIACISNSTFTLQNYPPGSTITWTKSNNLAYVGGQGTNNYTVKASTNWVSGQAWVQASINGATFRKTFWVGRPGQPVTNPYGYPTVQMSLGQIKSIRVTSASGYPYQYIWNITGSIEKISGGGSQIVVEAVNTGWGNFRVKTRNQCGYSADGGGSVNVSSGGGGGMMLSVSPNPASSDMTISVTSENKKDISAENEQWDLKIYNLYYVLQVKRHVKGSTVNINTSTWKEGIYMIKAICKGNVLSERVIIKK